MAHLIPIDNTAFTTPGERRFYAFLRDAVKPDSDCLAWYSPSVDGLEPDFVLYTPEEGLIVFEVKDWTLSQISAADPRSFTLTLADGRKEERKNPLQQGRAYVFALLNRIKNSCKRLLSTEPGYQGKPRLPVQCGFVFTNIKSDEFTATKLKNLIPADKILFADDLALAAAQSGGQSVARLRGKLAAMFPPAFSFKLTSDDIAALRELLWPQVRLVLPKRAGGPYQDEDAGLGMRLMDAQQESLARRLDAPKAIIEGPAGSGKSLVLAAKAVEAHTRLRQSGSGLPVLVVCFNLTLVHYLKRLLAGNKARLGRNGIQVTHFYELCRALLREPSIADKEDSGYYELVTRMALDSAPETSAYGAIFVDEGQDFSDDMLAVLQKCLSPDGMLWIALDSAQNLYDPSRAWLNDAAFRRFKLRYPYRATQKLTKFCESLSNHQNQPEQNGDETPPAFSVQSLEGEAPRLHQVAAPAEGAAYIVDRIRYLHEQGLPYSEITLLYASRRYGGLDIDLPRFLLDTLEENGILASWPSCDAQSKAAWDITTDSVTISTIHSMKGMDAEAVFIIGLDALKPGHSNSASLAYVASTRARRFLDILYMTETPLIETLAKSLLSLNL